jgi:hypothetical protein
LPSGAAGVAGGVAPAEGVPVVGAPAAGAGFCASAKLGNKTALPDVKTIPAKKETRLRTTRMQQTFRKSDTKSGTGT